jgi:hypothetical protein
MIGCMIGRVIGCMIAYVIPLAFRNPQCRAGLHRGDKSILSAWITSCIH